jgi:CRISPR-associated protein Cmr3
MYRALFRVLEPYLFRGPGEFDPSTRGVYSSAYSLLVPSPSTIAGAIATTFEYMDTSSAEWDYAYSIVLKGAKLRGPYLRRGSTYYVENRVNGVFLRLDDVSSYSDMKRRQLCGEMIEEQKEREIMKRGFIPKKLTFTGIGLKTRTDEMRKIADEERGLIYTANFIDYLSGKDVKDANIETTIEFDVISEKMETGKYIVRLGGEGRTSFLEILKVDSYICRIPERTNLLYVLSPILYETGIEFVKKLKEELWEAGDIKIYGKIEILGTGYSEVREKRKPIYQALLPGSVISLERSVEGRRIYEEGVGVGKELGFGSVIPVER